MRRDEESFFAGDAEGLAVYRAIRDAVDALGPATVRVSRSQIAFRRRRTFAAVWRPSQYLAGDRPPLVLTLFLSHRDESPRWKSIVEPRPGRFTHHEELRSPAEVDDDLVGRVAKAWRESG